jgi:hypothetical protein
MSRRTEELITAAEILAKADFKDRPRVEARYRELVASASTR